MDESTLDAYIQAFRSEGVLQGEGAFTVNRQKAISKLARYLLPEDGSWVLRVLQAANKWKARTVRSIETKAYSRLEIELPRRLHVTDIRLAMMDQRSEDEAADIFCQAVKALSGSEGRVVGFSVQDAQRAVNFLLANGTMNETEEPASLEPDVEGKILLLSPRESNESSDLLERGNDTRWRFAHDFVGRTESEEYLQLFRRGRASSARLWSNGERLDDLNLPDITSHGAASDFIGVLFAKGREAKSSLTVPHGVSRYEKAYRNGLLPQLHGPLAWLRFQPGEQAGCLLGVHSTWTSHRGTPSATSKLRFVKDGVIVATAHSHFLSPIIFDLFVSPERLRTDITGLRAEIPESLMEKFEDYLTQFRAPLCKLSQYLGGFSSYHRSKVVHPIEGMDIGSKLRYFANGGLRRRRHHAIQLDRTLRGRPFDSHGLGSL